MSSAKQFKAFIRGPLYNKPFKQNIQALDDALEALKERCNTLRDGKTAKIDKTTSSTYAMASKIAATGAVTDSRVQETQARVLNLQQETEAVLSVANHTDAQVSHIRTEFTTFGEGQAGLRTKIDDIHDAQHIANEKVEALTDIQQVFNQVAKAMALGVENAACTYIRRYWDS